MMAAPTTMNVPISAVIGRAHRGAVAIVETCHALHAPSSPVIAIT
jgi:hypothetical protein